MLFQIPETQVLYMSLTQSPTQTMGPILPKEKKKVYGGADDDGVVILDPAQASFMPGP